jgi:hypothetical protein
MVLSVVFFEGDSRHNKVLCKNYSGQSKVVPEKGAMMKINGLIGK